MKLNFAKKIFILAVCTFVLVLVVDIIFTNMLVKNIIGINDKIRQLNLSTQERERESALASSVMNSEEDRRRLDAYFVAAGDSATVDFTTFLEDKARQLGLQYVTKSLDYENVIEPANVEGISVIRFRFTVTGSWSKVFVFLIQVENLSKIVSVNNVHFNLDNTEGVTKNAGTNFTAELDFSVAKLKN